MNECFVNYPKVPTLNQNILGDGTKRIQTRIEQESFFLVRLHTKHGIEDKGYHLPKPPKNCPRWSYALTLPGGLDQERGLVFVLGNYWCFWSFDTESSKTWQESDAIPNKNFLMAALETDPTPFDKFCKELLLANKIFKENLKEPLPPNNWPKNLHSHWFEILMETDCCGQDLLTGHTLTSQGIQQNDRVQRKLKLDINTTRELIENLRRGAIVSMAQRSPYELNKASEIVTNITKKTAADNKWMSLLDLINLKT